MTIATSNLLITGIDLYKSLVTVTMATGRQ